MGQRTCFIVYIGIFTKSAFMSTSSSSRFTATNEGWLTKSLVEYSKVGIVLVVLVVVVIS